MKQTISLFFATIILLNILTTTTASATFDETFFNLNGINYYDASEDCYSSSSSSSSSINLSGNDNAEKIWNFLKSKGLSDVQAGGILGGLYGEAGFDPTLNEYGNGIGFGIAQWSFGRRTNLENYAKEKGKPVEDLGLQLDFLWHELETSYRSDLDVIKSANDVETVVKQWVGGHGWGFERPAAEHIPQRNADGVQVAKQLIQKFGGRGDSGGSSAGQSSNSGGSGYTFIGDSLTVGVQDKLGSSFSGSNVDAFVGRGINQPGQGGGSILNSLNGLTLNQTVVINNGANDSFEPIDKAKEMLDKLKDKKVILITSYSGDNYERTNSNISALAKEYNNITVLDWKAYVDANGGREKIYTNADGMNFVHMSEEGKELYVKFLSEKLSGQSSSNSSSSNCGSSEGAGGDFKFATSADASHTTSDGFSSFEQCDPRWANEHFGGHPDNFMCKAACGPTALATGILALTGKSLNPLDLSRQAIQEGHGASDAEGTAYSVVSMGEKYGLRTQSIGGDVESINNVLRNGGLAMVAGTGNGPFLGVSHWIIIRKITPSGKWLTANPGRNNLDEVEYDPAEISSMIHGSFALYKK